MKLLSITTLMELVNDVHPNVYYTKVVEIDEAEVLGDDIVIERFESSGKKRVKVQRLTKVGQHVNDIFTTIDAINQVDVRRTQVVTDVYKIEEYRILDALLPFIREGAITVVPEVGMMYLDDLLEPYSPWAEYKGEVLTPDLFLHAQLALMKALNPKYTQLSSLEPIERTRDSVATADVYNRPVLIDGSYKCLVRTDDFSLYPLVKTWADKDEYVTTLTNGVIRTRLTKISDRLTEISNSRLNQNSKAPASVNREVDKEAK